MLQKNKTICFQTCAMINVIHSHTEDRTAQDCVVGLKSLATDSVNTHLGLPMGARSVTSLNGVEALLFCAKASAASKALSVSRKARMSPLLCTFVESYCRQTRENLHNKHKTHGAISSRSTTVFPTIVPTRGRADAAAPLETKRTSFDIIVLAKPYCRLQISLKESTSGANISSPQEEP